MSTVIKAIGPIRAADGASFNFDDMGLRAIQYLEQVREQAAQILAKAEQDAAAIRRRAEQGGQQAATRAAEKMVDEKVGRHVATLLPALQKAINQIQDSRPGWLHHWEKSAVHVAAAIAERVIRREVQRKPEITLSLVREALELAAGSAEVRLCLHPDDHAAIGTQAAALAAQLSPLGQVQIVPDAGVSLGGCRVETRHGTIDQQFEAQLARIEQELI